MFHSLGGRQVFLNLAYLVSFIRFLDCLADVSFVACRMLGSQKLERIWIARDKVDYRMLDYSVCRCDRSGHCACPHGPGFPGSFSVIACLSQEVGQELRSLTERGGTLAAKPAGPYG